MIGKRKPKLRRALAIKQWQFMLYTVHNICWLKKFFWLSHNACWNVSSIQFLACVLKFTVIAVNKCLMDSIIFNGYRYRIANNSVAANYLVPTSFGHTKLSFKFLMSKFHVFQSEIRLCAPNTLTAKAVNKRIRNLISYHCCLRGPGVQASLKTQIFLFFFHFFLWVENQHTVIGSYHHVLGNDVIDFAKQLEMWPVNCSLLVCKS